MPPTSLRSKPLSNLRNANVARIGPSDTGVYRNSKMSLTSTTEHFVWLSDDGKTPAGERPLVHAAGPDDAKSWVECLTHSAKALKFVVETRVTVCTSTSTFSPT